MSSIKKQCSNVSTATYSGKEQSPLRFGLSAEGYPLHTILEGFDKLYWKVEVKNNRKVWIRNLTNDKITHEDPVINDTIEKNETNNVLNDPEINSAQIISQITSNAKKTTDYNIFLSYRLKQLKEENKGVDYENKTLFNKVMEEWKELKTSSSQLKLVIEKIKLEEEKSEKIKVPKKISKKTKKDKLEDVVTVSETTSVTDASNVSETTSISDASSVSINESVPITNVVKIKKVSKRTKKETIDTTDTKTKTKEEKK